MAAGRRTLEIPRPTQQVLANRDLEIGWVADEVDLFFVEIQGSAGFETTDHTKMTLNYASADGKKYRAIGTLLLQEGKIPAEKMSMQAIREYLRQATPEEVRRVLDYNESFVFFRIIDGGAHGCFDYEVTQHRSVALDQSVYPANAIGFLDVDRPAILPDGTIGTDGRISRIIFNQDTGGAIKGPGRVDLFWGSGVEEERLAGVMQTRGRLFLFVPKVRPSALFSAAVITNPLL
jgi:membrane-bound lytic murein transglycosylase A